MKAKPDSSDSLVFECDFDEPPEKVWRALTEPELLEAWLAKDGSGESRESRDARTPAYEILSAEPHRRLRYRWRDRELVTEDTGDREPREVDSVVTVELSAGSAGGTHLRLTHGEFTIVSDAPRTTSSRVTTLAGARRRRAQPISCGLPFILRRAA
jgi:uncharacterized protein YndB with AHSA1/START domain